MALDFPSSPAEGQVYYGPTGNYIYRSGAWQRVYGTALFSNKVVNGSMQISQQNADNPINAASGLNVVDNWVASGNGSDTAQRITSVTLNNSKYRLYMNIAATMSSTSNYIYQYIEGNRLIDFNWGTANAIPAVFRFGMRATKSGAYTCALRNGSNNRTISWLFNLEANIDKELIFPVPPSFTGSWNYDNNNGLSLWIIYAYPPVWDPPPGEWTDTNNIACAGANSATAAGENWQLFDVGLYADPMWTGVPPPFQGNHFEDDLRECQRYWYRAYGQRGMVSAATTFYKEASVHPVPMRAVPSVALVGTALRGYDGGAAPTMGAGSIVNSATTAQHLEVTATSAGLTSTRRGGFLIDGPQETNYIAVSARLAG